MKNNKTAFMFRMHSNYIINAIDHRQIVHVKKDLHPNVQLQNYGKLLSTPSHLWSKNGRTRPSASTNNNTPFVRPLLKDREATIYHKDD